MERHQTYKEIIKKDYIKSMKKAIDNSNQLTDTQKDIFYIRYVDDFVFLAKDKQDLILIKKFTLEFLEDKLKLSVSPRKLILNKIECGIPFLGYNIFRHKLKIRNDTIRRFKRRIREYSIEKKLNSLISFKGHCDLANKKLISSLSTSTLNLSSNKKFKYKKFLKILYGSRKQEAGRWEEIIISIFCLTYSLEII
jgi:hypothetical protein